MKRITSLHSTFLLNSALAPYLDAFNDRLRRGRYAAVTINSHVSGIAHFARWMAQQDLSVQSLDESSITQFLNEHLPCCDCPSPILRSHGDLRAALGHLLAVLREQGVVSIPPPPTGDIADELRRYDEHMNNARGLAEGTRSGYLRIVQRLLLHKFADRPVVFTELQPIDIRQFIIEQLERVDTISNGKALASTLRDYLRYRATCGDHISGMLGAISSPADWGLASLPRALNPDDIKRLLKSFNSSLPSPKRGYAIVRCALDLGLRSKEIAELQLTDIDWRAGIVTLNGTKGMRQDVLPLPVVTGKALADYVRFERPKTTNPAVFVRTLAPRDQPIGVDAIRRVIREAYHRIGLTHGRSHALRHALACRLVNQGSSLKEVADILRHRSLDTALIYAKLDYSKLVAVALPWPGSAT
jgi:site-specific recombinase XerD